MNTENKNAAARAGKTGWYEEGSEWYYYVNGVRQTGWFHAPDGFWYYLEPAKGGAMKNGWLKDGAYWYFLDPSGHMVMGWREISGQWYYFDPSGRMITEWREISGYWYFFRPAEETVGGVRYPEGSMVTGWRNNIRGHEGKYYYFLEREESGKPEGSMAIGWKQVDGEFYYLSPNEADLGQMQYRWLNLGKNWYYLGNSGARYTGWHDDIPGYDGKWFYFNPTTGIMAESGSYVIDGIKYLFYTDGTLSNKTLGELDKEILSQRDFKIMTSLGYILTNSTPGRIEDSIMKYIADMRQKPEYQNKYYGYMDENGIFIDNYSYTYPGLIHPEHGKFHLNVDYEEYSSDDIKKMHQSNTVLGFFASLVPGIGFGLSFIYTMLNAYEQSRTITDWGTVDNARAIIEHQLETYLDGRPATKPGQIIPKVGPLFTLLGAIETCIDVKNEDRDYYVTDMLDDNGDPFIIVDGDTEVKMLFIYDGIWNTPSSVLYKSYVRDGVPVLCRAWGR